jgi:hypothetical protein
LGEEGRVEERRRKGKRARARQRMRARVKKTEAAIWRFPA